jgi:hypothetical protein
MGIKKIGSLDPKRKIQDSVLVYSGGVSAQPLDREITKGLLRFWRLLMDRENQIKMIKLGDINPGHNKYDGSTVYGVGGVSPTIAARDYKGAKLILSVLVMSTKEKNETDTTRIYGQRNRATPE